MQFPYLGNISLAWKGISQSRWPHRTIAQNYILKGIFLWMETTDYPLADVVCAHAHTSAVFISLPVPSSNHHYLYFVDCFTETPEAFSAARGLIIPGSIPQSMIEQWHSVYKYPNSLAPSINILRCEFYTSSQKAPMGLNFSCPLW